MGAAAEWATRVGCNWSAPRFLRWSGLPVLSLFLATLVGHSIDVDGSIAATAEIYGALLAVALITGLLLERGRRAWCRLLCPIGSLLGVFSRLGAVQFAYPDRKIGLPDAYSTAGVCPTMIDTARKSESRHCIECFKCVNPEAKGSIRLQLRSPGDEVRAIDGHSPSWSEVLLVFAGTGTILGALVRGQVRLGQIRSAPMVRWVAEPSWSWLARPGPSWLTGAHPWAVFFSCLICMLAGAFLYAFLLAPMSALSSWLASRRTGPASRRQLFQLLGYQFFPVAALSVLSGLSRPLQDLLNSALPPLRLGTACGVVLILVGIAWSLHTGERILRRAGIAPSQRWLALLPGLLGSALAGFAWWPVVIG
ncbi:MAG TPA: 4Fe-4S binding protein [Anaeromyxobacter sp.]|nr:4Fe-4S binding protein [Anaeromyxobacter sp.]